MKGGSTRGEKFQMFLSIIKKCELLAKGWLGVRSDCLQRLLVEKGSLMPETPQVSKRSNSRKAPSDIGTHKDQSVFGGKGFAGFVKAIANGKSRWSRPQLMGDVAS